MTYGGEARTSFHTGTSGTTAFISLGSAGSVTRSLDSSVPQTLLTSREEDDSAQRRARHRNSQPICGFSASSFIFTESCSIFSKCKSLSTTNQAPDPSAMVPAFVSGASQSENNWHLVPPTGSGGESTISSRLPRPATSPLPPLPAHHLASPASGRLVPHSPCDCCHFPRLGDLLFSASVHRLLCSVRSWEKRIGEALSPGDLNNDVGVFLPVGHFALGFTAPIRTGRSVCRIWTVPGLLRSSKCRAEAQGMSSIPPHFLSLLLSFRGLFLPSCDPGTVSASPSLFSSSHLLPCVCLAPLHSALLPSCLVVRLSRSGFLFSF